MNFAPVLIPTLCRFDKFKSCVDSLSKCTYAEKTHLFIALDYPLEEEHWKGYDEIKQYIATIHGFKEVTVFYRESNYGVSKNINTARSFIFQTFGSIILTEDDNVFSVNFLDYINKGLIQYKDDKSITAICGYSYPVNWVQSSSNAIFIQNYFSAWGYGIWKDRFDELQLKIGNKFDEEIFSNKKNAQRLKKSLKNWYYAIGLITAQYIHPMDITISIFNIIYNRFCIYPKLSLVRNIGWDGSGINHNKNIGFDFMTQKIDDEIKFAVISVIEKEYHNNNLILENSIIGRIGNIKQICKILCFNIALSILGYKRIKEILLSLKKFTVRRIIYFDK